jgi:hypothetical protein
MSMIPPNWLGSILQSHGAQARASEKSARDAVEQARQAERGSFSDSLHNVIENDDKDSSVNADAEGRGGGPGRSRTGPDDEAGQPPSDDGAEPGALDIEA